jgi:hypothetical protein
MLPAATGAVENTTDYRHKRARLLSHFGAQLSGSLSIARGRNRTVPRAVPGGTIPL